VSEQVHTYTSRQVYKETGVSEKEPLYKSPGEQGKRGFEDLECYKLALELMAKIHAFSKTLPPDYVATSVENEDITQED
jgi:hypothetical protein